MPSDTRARHYPERYERGHARHPDPLVSRLEFQLGMARKLGYFGALARAGASGRAFVRRKIEAAHARHDVAPLP